MSQLSFMEAMKSPTGFISGFLHTSEAQFVQLGDGTDPKQGYFILPKSDVAQEMHLKNLIVSKASVLMAKRMRPGTSWGAGITHLEVGTGVGSGTLQAPQTETVAQTALRTPLARKGVDSWTYLDVSGNPTTSETHVMQLTTTFNETDAVGAIVEMGLFGGDATNTVGSGYMFNYKTFPVWNKQDTMKLTIVWKLTF